jgi:hypothetical protein
MYDQATRHRAMALIAQGQSFLDVSLTMGISQRALRDWWDNPGKLSLSSKRTCPRCSEVKTLVEPRRDYAYLLGLYLGDGCITRPRPSKDVWALRVMCADAWPGLVAECRQAMMAVRPGNSVCTIQKEGCVELASTSKHWPCLFPQHGPGRKHQRKIELEPWQEEIVSKHPGDFARGLFHSDGCRLINRVRRPVQGGDRFDEYPRYLFVNMSADIHRLCGEALDRLGVAWRFSKPTTISVARREAVARLDEFVGPKY